MPLYAFDRRACDRLVTLRALAALVAEVDALTPATAFETGYLRREARADDDDDDVDARVVERRAKRRAKREAAFVSGDADARAEAAAAAAREFLRDFCDEWVPKLARGDDRSALEKRARRPPPGMKEVRPLDAGADADAALEALWAFRDDAPWAIKGGELVAPSRMGVRLRELRAHAAAAARAELKNDVRPELHRARAKYTDYAEEEPAPGAEPDENDEEVGWDV